MVAPVLDAPRIREAAPTARLSREQLVDRIQTLNPTAGAEFLDQFGEDALALYHEHLVHADQPRVVRSTPWVRPADTPAIVTREARDWPRSLTR